MFWIWSPVTYIYIYSHFLRALFVLSSHVHCESSSLLFFSDDQGNGAFSSELVKTNSANQGIVDVTVEERRKRKRSRSFVSRVQNYLCCYFLIFLMLNVPLFWLLTPVLTSWPMQSKQATRRQNKLREKQRFSVEPSLWRTTNNLRALWKDTMMYYLPAWTIHIHTHTYIHRYIHLSISIHTILY